MPRRAEGDWGRIPETAGHARLVRWVGRFSIAHLADLVDVKRASAHAWFWRDARPSDEMVKRIVEVIGGTRDEWLTDEEKKALRKATRLRQRRLKELEKGAA